MHNLDQAGQLSLPQLVLLVQQDVISAPARATQPQSSWLTLQTQFSKQVYFARLLTVQLLLIARSEQQEAHSICSTRRSTTGRSVPPSPKSGRAARGVREE